MPQFTEKYRDQIVGILSGFDRLVFRGSLRRLNYGHWDRALGALVARGMEEYLWQNKILCKPYVPHVKQVSERLQQTCLKRYRERNVPVIFLAFVPVDKEKLARRIAAEKKIRSGPVCALSSLAPIPRWSTGARTSFAGSGGVVCCTTTKSIRRWDGCMPGFRLGLPATCRSGKTGGNGSPGR